MARDDNEPLTRSRHSAEHPWRLPRGLGPLQATTSHETFLCRIVGLDLSLSEHTVNAEGMLAKQWLALFCRDS